MFITKHVREISTGDLKIIHQVVKTLQLMIERKINSMNDVMKMDPCIDMTPIFRNHLSRSAADERRDVFIGAIDTTQSQHAGRRAEVVQAEDSTFSIRQ